MASCLTNAAGGGPPMLTIEVTLPSASTQHKEAQCSIS